jgi:predicted lipoprotein
MPFTTFRMKSIKFILSTIAVILTLIACNKDAEKPDFDRGAMLSDLTTNVIKASVLVASTELASLQTLSQTFEANPDLANLNAVQNQFIEAYKKFQHCKPFDFGPFEDHGIIGALNTYPTDTLKINNNISLGVYSLSSVENAQAVGFPALDFLLFNGDDSDILNSFTAHADATKKMTLLNDLVSKMKTEFELAKNQWDVTTSGFVAADGNDVGGSTSILFNAFVMDLELLKNAKIGIPAGYQTGGTTLPNYVEGYYSQSSIDLAKESVLALKDVFTGSSGIGFEEYIRDVEDGVGNSLADQIISRFDICTTSLDAIGNPLSQKVDTDAAGITTAYNNIKTLVTYIKTDMSSALGLLITFQDNDGD